MDSTSIPFSALFSRTARHRSGFTLIGLVITLAIVAILAAIAYPAYRHTIVKSRRSDARTTLMNDAQQLEQCYAEYGSYDPSGTTTGCPPPFAEHAVLSAEGYYSITASSVSPSTYTLKAVPTTKGDQNADTTCAQFTLDQTGDRRAYSASGSATSSVCW